MKMNEGQEDSVKEEKEESPFRFINNIKMTKEKKEKAVILFLAGIFFLLAATPVSSFTGKKSKQKEMEKITSEKQEVKNEKNDAYIEALENKLEQTIGGMEGAGKVLVMITLKDSGEKILDKNQPYESESENSKEEGREIERTSIKSDPETVLIEEEGDTAPIIVQEMYPDIKGVVVVCEGGDDKVLAIHIKEAVQALFSIDAHKIVVCKLKKE
ncbi:MAG: hypothetical protein HFJ06_06490 [Lachnospiraceae bacterium]|mgnify:CR=1 FL=1|nr:hypothetical protein [Lachnospiraceae bacterium]